MILLPFVLLGVPFIPTIIEALRRKDKGPKEVPDQTTYEKKPDLDLPRLERARGEARAKAPGEVIRITGDASIPEGTEINNHLVVQGNLKIGRKSNINGSVKAFGNIEIDESSTVEGHILSEGTVVIGRNCIIKGVVDSLKDIILEENAVVEAISTEKTVKVGPNARINQRILSGASIIASSQLPIELRKEDKQAREKATISQPHAEKEIRQFPRTEPTKQPEGVTKAERISDQIFAYIEDRIRRLDEKRITSTEVGRVEGLTPLEVNVLKAAMKGNSLEEICLRLLKDPSEVETIIDGLIKKGHLDENLRSKQPSVKRLEKPISSLEKNMLKNEHPKQVEELSEDEQIERLIASKMREELKRKIEAKEDESHRTIQPKDILNEWEKFSSSMWGTREKKEQQKTNLLKGFKHKRASIGDGENTQNVKEQA